MADANTTRYAYVKPEVGASADTWGGKLNQNFDDLDAITGVITTTGSANAYVLTTGLSLSAYVSGQAFKIKTNFANTGAATINVDTLGAKSIVKNGSTALASGDMASGQVYEIAYDGTNFQLVGKFGQTEDADLTAIAALGYTSGSYLLQKTAADTWSLTLTPSVTTISVGDGSAAAPSVKVGDEQNGLASTSANTLNLIAAGVIRATVGDGFITFISPAFAPDGEAALPGWGFASDPDCGFYRIGSDNIGFTLGGAKRIDFSTTLFDFTVATRAKLAVSAETSGTLTAASSNKKVNASGGITIDGNVHTADDQIKIYAGSSARTITQGSTGSPTQRLHGSSTTGNLTLAARGVAVVDFISATEWVISGDVS